MNYDEVLNLVPMCDSEGSILQDKIQQLQSDLKEANEKLANIKYLNREEVEKIFDDTVFRSYKQNDLITARDKAITALLALAIPTVDRDKIVEVIKEYFYMTIDSVEYNKNSHDSYMQNVARIYSQKEIETEEGYITDKLKEELTQEYIDIANEILNSIGGE